MDKWWKHRGFSKEPHGALWSLMETHAAWWSPVEPSGALCSLMEPYEAFWSLMMPYGTLWNPMETDGALRSLMVPLIICKGFCFEVMLSARHVYLQGRAGMLPWAEIAPWKIAECGLAQTKLNYQVKRLPLIFGFYICLYTNSRSRGILWSLIWIADCGL